MALLNRCMQNDSSANPFSKWILPVIFILGTVGFLFGTGGTAFVNGKAR